MGGVQDFVCSPINVVACGALDFGINALTPYCVNPPELCTRTHPDTLLVGSGIVDAHSYFGNVWRLPRCYSAEHPAVYRFFRLLRNEHRILLSGNIGKFNPLQRLVFLWIFLWNRPVLQSISRTVPGN